MSLIVIEPSIKLNLSSLWKNTWYFLDFTVTEEDSTTLIGYMHYFYPKNLNSMSEVMKYFFL